jgi:hypothetical protein
MIERRPHAPHSIYTVADHLDAVLAAAEDILKLGRGINESELIRLELVAITHALQARARLREWHVTDQTLVDEAALFLAGTAALEAKRLNAALHPDDPIGISEAYLIGQVLPIGALTDLASAMLDALESVFILYDNETEIETEKDNASDGDATPPLLAPETQALVLARMD